MGSAPAGGSFEGRLGSSARRGAYVGPGVPGAYRVTRSRTTQAQSLRRARPNPFAWVQPDDVEVERSLSVLIMTEYGTEGAGALNDFFGVTPTIEAQMSSLGGGDDFRAQTIVVLLSTDNLDADPVSPTPPPGMSVEYETAAGEFLEASIEGELIVNADAGVDPPDISIQEMLTADLVPGEINDDFVYGPTHTTAGVGVWSQTGTGTLSFGPLTQTFPAEQVLGWRIGDQNALDEVTAVGDGIVYVAVGGGGSISLTYTYRPPRYRFV